MELGYTTILHEPRLKLNISCNEYCLSDMVYNLSTNQLAPVKGWCSASQSMIGEALGISRQSVSTMVKKLCKAGILIKSDSGKLLRCADLWVITVVNFNFKRQKSLHGVKKTDKTGCKESLHGVKKVDNELSRKFTGECKESLHNNNKDKDSDNIIPPNVGKIETKIPEGWSLEVKRTVIQFLNYRQQLPTKEKIKTQQGWNGKINLFQKILNQHGPIILIKAINLSIEKEYKNVDPEWLFNQYPELRTKNLVNSSIPALSQQESKKVLQGLYKKHRNIWKEQYTQKAKTNFVEALRMFYFDNPQLKPSNNGAPTA